MSGQRIQRRRTRGWRMPTGAVYVGRPTRWGNPFHTTDWRASFRAVGLVGRGDRAGMHAAAVELYRLWLVAERRPADPDDDDFWQREVWTVRPPILPPTHAEIRTHLAGRDLVCWCPLDVPCDGDVLRALARGDVPRPVHRWTTCPQPLGKQGRLRP